MPTTAAMEASSGVSAAQSDKMARVFAHVRGRRDVDPLTRAGTALEQQAGTPVMFRVRQEAGKPVNILATTPMRGVSPLDIERYDKKAMPNGDYLLYPVLRKELKNRSGRLPGLTYDEMILTNYEPPSVPASQGGDAALAGFMGYDYESFDGYEYAGLGGLWDFVKKAATSVKKVVLHPVKTIKTAVAKRKVASYAANLSPEQAAQVAAATGGQTAGGTLAAKGLKFSPSEIFNLIQSGKAAGIIPEDVAVAAEQELAQGDPEAAYDIYATATGEKKDSPAWLMPALIIGGAVLVMKMKK